MATALPAARRPRPPLVFVPRARRGPLITPLMGEFVVLSILLHVLAILLFGAPAGGSPHGRAIWGSLSVVIRDSFREAAPELRLDREVPHIEREALPKRAPTPTERRPEPTPVPLATSPRFEAPPAPPAPEKPVPKAEPQPAETPYVVPQVIERLRDRPKQFDEPVPTVPPPSEPAPVQKPEAPPAPPKVEAPPAPKAEPAPPPTPKIEPPKVEAPLPKIEAPPPAPVVETPKVEAPLPKIEPTPPPRAEPAPAPVQAPIAQPIVPEAVRIPPPPERVRVQTPALPSAPVATPPEIETPAPPPPVPAAAPTPPPASGVSTPAPEPAGRPEAPKAAPAAPREEVSPFRRAPPPPRDESKGGGKGLDLDAIRSRAGEIARQGTGNRAPLSFPMPPLPEKKSKIEQALEKARKPDCRDAYKDLGLLAVVPLVANEFGEGTCRW